MEEVKDKEVVSLRKIIVEYAYHWKMFLFFFLMSVIASILYLSFYPTTYEIMARIQLQDDKNLGTTSLGMGEAAGLMKSFGFGSVGSSVITMDDELAKLLSNDLLKTVVADLGLNVIYKKPYSYKYKMYKNMPVLLTPDSIANMSLNTKVSFHLDIDKTGKVKLRMESEDQIDNMVFDTLPASFVFNGYGYSLAYKDLNKRPFSQDIDVLPASWVAEDLSEELLIEEYSKNSNIIEFTCQDYEIDRGKDLLNKLIYLYNLKETELKKLEGEESMNFLDLRIREVVAELNNVESMIEQYKTKNSMTDLEFDIPFYVEQMKDLKTKMIELEAQNRLIGFLDDYVNDPKNKYSLIPALLATGEGEKSSPIAIYNETLLERERIMQSSKADNPLIAQINKQVDQLRASVFLSIKNAQKGVALTLADLKSKEDAILAKMGKVPSLEKEYIDYKRNQEIYQAVYLVLLQKREEIALSINNMRDRGRIVDHAFVKQRPVAPRRLFVAIGILACTLIFPVLMLFIKSQYIALRNEFAKIRNVRID